MIDFLDRTAQFILQHYSPILGDVVVVLPNRRAGLFLRDKLSKQIDKPLWSPQITAIDELMVKLSGLQVVDQTELLFVLYSVYLQDEGDKAEPFEAFNRWAPALLNDFNEIDANLIDTEQFFANLYDIRRIENWNPEAPDLTEFQLQYLHFQKSLGRWYVLLRDQLLAESKAWSGLAFRTAVKQATDNPAGFGGKRIVFAGFNALTKAEETIMHIFHKQGLADLLWDADRYLLDDSLQEGGRFLRQHQQQFFKKHNGDPVHFEHIGNDLKTHAKKITAVGVARNVAQARAMAWKLNQFTPEELASPKTVVVLADEQLLLPALHALPPQTGDVNVTMGFPMRYTPIATLAEYLFLLQENANRFNIYSREGERKFYHADLLRLVRHPYMRQQFWNSTFPEKLTAFLTEKNIVFIAPGQIRQALPAHEDECQLLEIWLQPWKTTGEAFDAIYDLIEHLRSLFIEQASKSEARAAQTNLELEFLHQFARIVRRLRTLTERWPFVQELRALRLLLMQTVQTTNLPFYGEPLAGLQIMGLLETRTLDFDRVILLATNENILPSARAQPSFIVYDLRVAFGLPVWHERDAVYAHHFYHLLQRASDVTLVYNTEPDTFGSGERSRFVTQVMYELPKINPQVDVETVLFDTGTPSSTEVEPIVIPKSERIQTRLRELATHGLSPSLLNSFRSCSLQFYFRYIAGLREAEDVEETIGADTLGTVMHAALENLFERVKGETLTPTVLQKLKNSIHVACRKAFEEFCPPEELGYGKNLLAERIAEKYLHTFFEKEIARAKKLEKSGLIWKVEALETELRSEVTINGEAVFLRGTADRIDRVGDTIQLIDYKTGKADDVELYVKHWDDVATNTQIGKSVQLLTYALMYADTTQYKGSLLSGIITFRELSKAQLLKPVKTPSGETLTTDLLDEFRQALTQLLQTIFDPQKSFSQTEERDTCRICAFNGICGRE